jgi:hypothetical protein
MRVWMVSEEGFGTMLRSFANHSFSIGECEQVCYVESALHSFETRNAYQILFFELVSCKPKLMGSDDGFPKRSVSPSLHLTARLRTSRA